VTMTRVADTKAEAATKLGSFQFTRGTLVCCCTWPHVLCRWMCRAIITANSMRWWTNWTSYVERTQMRLPYGTIASIGCMLMQTSIWRCAIHCATIHCAAIHCAAIHCATIHCATIHCATIHCATIHCATIHCATIHCACFIHCALFTVRYSLCVIDCA
jgi:hypothetical protein